MATVAHAAAASVAIQAPVFPADRWVRRTTTASVVLLAGIAAVVSYGHMHALALQHGEGAWAAALIPLSCDGMILASSMALLSESRLGGRGGVLPWALLIIGALASLAANIAAAEACLAGRVIAAWPSFRADVQSMSCRRAGIRQSCATHGACPVPGRVLRGFAGPAGGKNSHHQALRPSSGRCVTHPASVPLLVTAARKARMAEWWAGFSSEPPGSGRWPTAGPDGCSAHRTEGPWGILAQLSDGTAVKNTGLAGQFATST